MKGQGNYSVCEEMVGSGNCGGRDYRIIRVEEDQSFNCFLGFNQEEEGRVGIEVLVLDLD